MGRSKKPPPAREASLFSFFNAATNKQSDASRTETGEAEDEADDILDDDDPSLSERTTPIKKRRRDDDVTQHAPNKFLKKAPQQEDTRPWTEKYKPQTLSQLVVHKKKIEDVRRWLEGVTAGLVPQTLLVLKGPAGAGKTTCLELLATSLKLGLVEWQSQDHGQISQTVAFEEFLSRAHNAPTLQLSTETVVSTGNEGKVIVVEEFPLLMPRNLDGFRSAILQYLVMAAQSRRAGLSATPLVLIITESSISSGNSAEGFSAFRLLGREILSHPFVATIEFNPVASSFLSKALQQQLEKHSASTGKRLKVVPQVIKKIAEVGDLRNATSTLEYLCSNLASLSAGSAKSSKSKSPKSSTARRKITAEEADKEEIMTIKEAMQMVEMRESNIGLFHAIGKIMYNKREASSDSVNKGLSEVDCELLAASTGVDVSTFICGLYENYLPSCSTASNEHSLETAVSCLDVLGEADLLSAATMQQRTTNMTSEGVRQEEVAFEMACRGLLESLPYPVKRQSFVKTSKGAARDAHKMHYPSLLRIWKPREELQSTLDGLVYKSSSGVLDAALEPLTRSWARSISQPGRFVSTREIGRQVISPRREMLLERAPYLSSLLSSHTTDLIGVRFPHGLRQEINRVGRLARAYDADADEDGFDVQRPMSAGQTMTAAMKVEDGVPLEKLYLSDDDIED